MRHTRILVRAQVRRPLRTTGAGDAFLRAAVAAAGMSVIGGPWSVLGTVPGNEGLSSVAVLDFSSVDLHEWPDRGLIHLSLYTCGEAPDQRAFRALFEPLGVVEYASAVVDQDELLNREGLS